MTPKRHLTLVINNLTNRKQPASFVSVGGDPWLHTGNWAFKLNQQHKHLYEYGLDVDQLSLSGDITQIVAGDSQFETVGTTQNTLLVDLHDKLQADHSQKTTERFGFDAEQNTPITLIGLHDDRVVRIFYVSDMATAFWVDETWLQIVTFRQTLLYMTATQKYPSTHYGIIGFWDDNQQLVATVTAQRAYI